MTIIFEEFIKSKTIYNDDDNINKQFDALRILIEKNIDIVTYNTKIKIVFDDINLLKLKKERDNYAYYYDYKSNEDIIDNISLESTNNNNKLCFIINGIETNFNSSAFTYISTAARFTKLQFKIIFNEMPNKNDEFVINYKSYLLNHSPRRFLALNTVKTNNIIYNDGFISFI